MEKSLRIKANIGRESVVHVPMKRDVDMFEMLSLNLSTEGIYKRHSSNYGVIIGRVTVNGGLGVPNAKISIFVPLKASDALRPEIKSLYPYRNITDLDSDGRRYNLLPMNYNDNVHVAVGSFPTSRAVLDNDIYLEIYEKYYKYTTVTNEAGDYMLYGVPVGTQTIHMDVDISDIGYLSQKPYHMIDKGYSEDMFDSPTKFKGGTNLDLLPQIFSENEALNVYPFWGDEEEDEIAITRKDFELQYEITPTCVFMGSVVTDSDENYISEGCTIAEKAGDMSQLRASEGKIEIMRYNPMGEIEEYTVKDNKLIDGNGVFCFQVPMNLNYVTTSEEGKLVRSIDSTVGIPTTARVRFRFTLEGDGENIAASHTMSYLVPNNPESSPIDFVTEAEYELKVNSYATFGNNFSDDTIKDDCFRDLLWNCVYSVKNYIPRVELRDDDEGAYNIGNGLQHTGIKGVNKSGAEGKNPFPYNKMNLSTSYLTWHISESTDSLLSKIVNIRKEGDGFFSSTKVVADHFFISALSYLGRYGKYFKLLRNFFFNSKTFESIQNEDELFARNLEDTDGVSFDFYNDWINGCLYFPKVKYDISSEMCDCSKKVSDLDTYSGTSYVVNDTGALDYYFGGYPTQDEQYGIPSEIVDNLRDFNRFDDGFLTTGGLTRSCIKESIYKNVKKWKWMGLEQEDENAPNTFIYRVAERKITNGLTVRKEGKSDVNNIQFSYAPLFFNDNELSGNTFNGFKTDIILLGAVDDTNFHGIPSVKGLKLPKTTATLVHTYRSDATGKNFNDSITEGETDTVITTNGDSIVYLENKLRDEDKQNQNEEEINVGGYSNIKNELLSRTSLYRTNGSFWGSTEYSKIRVLNRFSRYWAPYNKLRGLLWYNNDTVDSSVYFRYKAGENSDWDRGMHCLLGGGLFFGRSGFSMFKNDYITKPKSCINLSRICELSVMAEDNMTFPNKNSRKDTGGSAWDINVQFQFLETTNEVKATLVNDINDPDFFDEENYTTLTKKGGVRWYKRPLNAVARSGFTIWVSSRIVKLSDKGNKNTIYWHYQEPCIWFKWGFNAVNTTEYEYVFVTVPVNATDFSVEWIYQDDYGYDVDWIDSSGRKYEDDLYCPLLFYTLNGQILRKEFSNQQSFFTEDNGDEVQLMTYRRRDTNGKWNKEIPQYVFVTPSKWNTKEDIIRRNNYNPRGGISTDSLGMNYAEYTNSGMQFKNIGTNTEPILTWTTSNDNPTSSPYYTTPNYPTEFTWGKNDGDSTYRTVMTNIYGVMGGTLNDGSDRLQLTNVNYLKCGMTGIIGDSEITDFTNRSLFATLNSVKLQVVDDEDDKSKTPTKRYDTKVYNINGFDGLLNGSVLKSYFFTGAQGQNEITLKHEETSSNEYCHFRYGEKPKFNVKGGKDKYFNKGDLYRFPVYENSFYFYFGIDSNQTALYKLKRNFL